MTFEDVVDQASAMVQRRGRVTYRLLKRQFHLDHEALEALKEELIYGQQLAVDEDGRVLIWTGAGGQGAAQPSSPPPSAPAPNPQEDAPSQRPPSPVAPHPLDAERRQLTVMFCDLVDSTALSGQLDPEDLRDVVRAYHQVCSAVITRFDGHIAQLLGDGLLVYFGYPHAHEDDPHRAIRTGLGILEAMGDLNARLKREKGIQLALRLGIHTGLVVVGAMGGAGRQEQLALGETPNIAARIQGLAQPNTVAISDASYRLVQGYFQCQNLGARTLRGVTESMRVHHVLSDSGATSRLDVAQPRGLTPLIGREQEVGLLLERWHQVKDGQGHVVLLTGDAGIGKSRLVQILKEHIAQEPHTRWECRSAEYAQNTALFPLVELFQRLLRFQAGDAPDEKFGKLEQMLHQYRLPLAESVPLFASLLSLPISDHLYSPLHLSPQRQRQKTLETLVAILLEHAEQHPVLFIVEDLHWSDPSTLELLNLVIDQTPTAALLVLLTCRPHFQPAWHHRSYLTELTVNRLAQPQIERMITQVAGGKTLPPAVTQQIVEKTDGIPLFAEEMTKALLESGQLQAVDDHYELTGAFSTFAIPATLQDSLMARLDRLVTAKAVAQYAAVIGRQFAYGLLQVVSQLDDATLRWELNRLVDAELVYQRGLPPHATYTFKHALIRDAAYQSLLRSTRQQYHQEIGQVLEAQFPEARETQPELLAHHYTEAGLTTQALPYWQRAGQQALQRSANLEAAQHLTMGLELLATLPETLARVQQELDLQLARGTAFIAIKGPAAPEVEQTYARAHALCHQIGETPQLFSTLRGLQRFYHNRGALRTARELGEQLLRLAQRAAEPTPLLDVHSQFVHILCFGGEYAAAQTHAEQGIALIDPIAERAAVLHHGLPSGVPCLAAAALTRWCLGFPAQAVQRSQEALALAQVLAHPPSVAHATYFAAYLHHRRREVPLVQTHAEALLVLATAQELPFYVGIGTCWRGWALAMQGQGEGGLELLHQGLAALLALGQRLTQPLCLTLLAEAAGHAGQVEEGLHLLSEALGAFEAIERGDLLSEVYRLQGELLMRQVVPDTAQVEACFQQALTIARRQQAKSWELRAAMSLSRLWQRQGKRAEARQVLTEIYGWFTEGFDTADLQEAQALLEALS